ncbi:MAG: lactate racemase domain-containing protein [Candidatus Poribacteria bacterium]|nr:lactate racemase domain-containing protein [Candidatus Poribacteria bacterium]
MQSAQVLTAAWYGDREVNLTFPDGWDLNVIGFEERPVLTEDQRRQAFHQPIGSPRISEMAQGKKSAVLIADDLTRPTPTSEVMPFILEELREGGIADEDILIFMGFGCHRQMRRDDITKKLGEDTVRRIRVKQNELDDPFVYLGETSRGIPLHINQWVMDRELKIGIGGTWPHGTAGFSGGGKMAIPGIASFETISRAHGTLKGGGRADNVENEFRLNSEEAARMAGLNTTVLTILNDRRQITGLFVGDVVEAHRAAVEVARDAYAIKLMPDADIVITTGYPRDHDLKYGSQGGWPMRHSQPEATCILINAGTEGVGYHRAGILRGKQLREEEGREREERKPLLRSEDWDYILLSDAVGPMEVLETHPRAKLMESWDEILDFLKQKYRDQKPKVAIYRSSAIAYPRE